MQRCQANTLRDIERINFASPILDSQCPATGVAQRPRGGANASIVNKVVLNSCLLLRLRILRFPSRIAHRQVEPFVIFLVPALLGILVG